MRSRETNRPGGRLVERLRPKKPVVFDKSHDESGRVGILMIGLMVIVLLVIFVGMSVTTVHLQHRRLLSCADRLAAVASSVTSPRKYYTSSPQGIDSNNILDPSSVGAPRVANRALAQLSQTTCKVGAGVEIVNVETETTHVAVSISTQSVIPCMPAVLSDVVAPRLYARSSARTL